MVYAPTTLRAQAGGNTTLNKWSNTFSESRRGAGDLLEDASTRRTAMVHRMAAEKSEAVQGLGRLGDLKDSKARAEKMTPEEGAESARNAAKAL